MTLRLPAKPLGTIEHLDDIAQKNGKTLGQHAGARRVRA